MSSRFLSRFIDDQGPREDFRDEQQIAEEEFTFAFQEFAEKPLVVTIEEWQRRRGLRDLGGPSRDYFGLVNITSRT